MIYAIIEPISPPASIPIYTPISPRPNGNANKHAKSKTKINSLMIVRPSETVPFPSPWNTFAAVAPNGTNNTNKHINCRNFVISGANWLLFDEYENIYAICPAKTWIKIHVINETINPSFTAYLTVVLILS